MLIENAFGSVPVRDLKAAVAWYGLLIGRPADSTPMPDVAEWKFKGGGWLQIYQLPERAGFGSVTLAVSSIDDIAAQVEKLGVDTSQRTSVKTLMITDLDGNHIAFAEAID